MTIRVDPSILKVGYAFLAYAEVRGVRVVKASPEANEELRKAEEEVRRKYKLEELKDHETVRAFRKFYWRLGIDPTKQRPASEALVRRVLRGRKMPRINNVVDAGNVVSLLTLIPIGIYDLGRVKGNLVLRTAAEGERFTPIGGREEVLTPSQIVLADEEKILHVFPHRDSVHTMVREDTKDVLVVACGVEGVREDTVVEAARKTAILVSKLAGGVPSEVRVATP